MRWRVLALVVIPTVAAIVLGAVRIEAARTTAGNFARVSQLASLGADVTALTQAVEDERDVTAGVIAARRAGDTALAGSLSGELPARYAASDADFSTVRNMARQLGPALSGAASADLTTAINAASALPSLRTFVRSRMTPLPMTDNYGTITSALLTFDNDIALGSSNARLSQSVSALASLAQLGDQVSVQRAILYAALLTGKFEPGAVDSLTAAQSNEASDLAAFQATAANLPAYQPAAGGARAGFSATTSAAAQFGFATQSPQVDATQAAELEAVIAGNAGNKLSGGVGSAQAWFANMTSKLSAIRGIEGDELAGIQAQADSLRQDAVGSERLTAVIVLVLLLLVLAATIIVAQSVTRPLRRLRADALDVASRRLPDVVRRLSESSDGRQAPEGIEIEPIGVDSTDEIGEVARAFDQVHSEAVRLAGEEAMLRANLNAMFVNLSRRSQSLIERQLGIIESLEQSEQDSDRLSSLFRLDHLATRMRRNSENLLVLAGHEGARKWTKPVPLVDVLRAAVSEIEQYDRITLNVQSGLVIAGRAASDVVHLTAELVENATTFSREDTQVFVTGQLLASGGVLVEVVDDGLGIPEEELGYANWRLENPPVIDVAISRRMGLFVVGRLAARHGIKVRLRPAPAGGLSALIWVPETVAEPEPARPAGGTRRRFHTGATRAVTVPAPPVPVPTSVTPIGAATVTISGARARAANSSWFGPGKVTPAMPGIGSEPGAATPGTGTGEQRLPIYDAVESDWFRRGGTPLAGDGPSPAAAWTSPADPGFLAAQSIVSPATADQTTGAGLPKRVPSANLVPGSVGVRQEGQQARPETLSVPVPRRRSPDLVRARLAEFQRRAREGRTDARQGLGTAES